MRREVLLLEEICSAGERCLEIARAHSPRTLFEQVDARDALLWNLTIVGEACGQLSEEFRMVHEDLPWSQPIRLRNRIVHGYWSVDLDLLHTVALQDLPPFVERVRSVLEALVE
jgi:uncharacterized protein with HEPN domain